MDRLRSSGQIDPLSPPSSSQLSNATELLGVRQHASRRRHGQRHTRNEDTSDYGGLNSEDRELEQQPDPEAPEPQVSLNRRGDVVSAQYKSGPVHSGKTRASRSIPLHPHEKVKLARIAIRNRATFLDCPKSGKFPDAPVWATIMNTFHERVRLNVFSSPIQVKGTLEQICRPRLNNSNGPEPPARSADTGALDDAVDFWNAVRKVRYLCVDLAKVHSSLMDVYSTGDLRRLCGVDDSVDVSDFNSMAFILPPLREDIQRLHREVVSQNRRRTRETSLYPLDSPSDSEDIDPSDDDVVKLGEPNPRPSIEKEKTTPDYLPTSPATLDKLIELEKAYIEQNKQSSKGKENLRACLGVPVGIMAQRDSLTLDRGAKTQSPWSSKEDRRECGSNGSDYQLNFKEEPPHTSPYIGPRQGTVNPDRDTDVAEANLRSSPISPPRLLSDLMGQSPGPGTAEKMDTGSFLQTIHNMTISKFNASATLPSSSLNNESSAGSSFGHIAKVKNDRTTTLDQDDGQNGAHKGDIGMIGGPLPVATGNDQRCAEPGTKVDKRRFREGTAPELRRENERKQREQQQKGARPLFKMIKPKELKKIPLDNFNLLEPQKQARTRTPISEVKPPPERPVLKTPPRMNASNPEESPWPERPRFKIPSPLPWPDIDEPTPVNTLPVQNEALDCSPLSVDDRPNVPARRSKCSKDGGRDMTSTDSLNSSQAAARSSSGTSTPLPPPTYPDGDPDDDHVSATYVSEQKKVSSRVKRKRGRTTSVFDNMVESHRVNDKSSSRHLAEETMGATDGPSTPVMKKRKRSKTKSSRQKARMAACADYETPHAESVQLPLRSSGNEKLQKRKRSNSMFAPASRDFDLSMPEEEEEPEEGEEEKKEEEQVPRREKISSSLGSLKPGPSQRLDSYHLSVQQSSGDVDDLDALQPVSPVAYSRRSEPSCSEHKSAMDQDTSINNQDRNPTGHGSTQASGKGKGKMSVKTKHHERSASRLDHPLEAGASFVTKASDTGRHPDPASIASHRRCSNVSRTQKSRALPNAGQGFQSRRAKTPALSKMYGHGSIPQTPLNRAGGSGLDNQSRHIDISGTARSNNRVAHNHHSRGIRQEDLMSYGRQMTAESEAILPPETPRSQIHMLSSKYNEVTSVVEKLGKEIALLKESVRQKENDQVGVGRDVARDEPRRPGKSTF